MDLHCLLRQGMTVFSKRRVNCCINLCLFVVNTVRPFGEPHCHRLLQVSVLVTPKTSHKNYIIVSILNSGILRGMVPFRGGNSVKIILPPPPPPHHTHPAHALLKSGLLYKERICSQRGIGTSMLIGSNKNCLPFEKWWPKVSGVSIHLNPCHAG